MRLRNIPEAAPAIEESPYVFTEEASAANAGSWKSLFSNNNPLYIEIGMGKGRFIMDNARKFSDINFLGIERYSSVLYRGLQKFEAEDPILKNLYFLCIDAKDIKEYFKKGEVDRIYLNFSDPWPKERHAKRRLTSSEYLDRYNDILSADGHIEFKTDNRDLFDFSVEEINNHPLWHIDEITYDLHNDSKMNKGNILTEYEEKFSSKGNPIYKLICSR